jgi:phasin
MKSASFAAASSFRYHFPFGTTEEQTGRRGVALDHNAKVTVMSSFEQGAKAARDNMRKGEAATQESLSKMERSFSTSVDGVRDFNLKMIELMRANAEASFDLAENLITAKSPNEIFETWKSFAEHQGQTLQKQTQELTALTQTVAQETMQPVKEAAGRFTKGT